jgi:ribosome-binding factor A
MSLKKSFRKKAPPCAELGPEDGQDPRMFFRKPTGKVTNRKALQLCAQVARTLSTVLAGECDDDLLRDLLVESIHPAPDSMHLLVTVSVTAAAGTVDRNQVLERLHRAYGMLRREVAAVIHRKRVPELTFCVAVVDDKHR